MVKDNKKPKTEFKRPTLEELLVHAIRKIDNGDAAGDPDSYEDWLLDHTGKVRFYLLGFTKLRSATRQTDAKFFHSLAERAIEIAQEEGWDEEVEGVFARAASYNQYRNAIILGRPMFFEHAAQVLLACECALSAAIEKGRYASGLEDVYQMMKILPATYNIDGFNSEALDELRRKISNFDLTVLSNTGQKSKSLLDNLAGGSCVTRKTARAIRSKTLQLLETYKNINVDIGDVRGRPGKKRLGHKNATTTEVVDLDDFATHID